MTLHAVVGALVTLRAQQLEQPPRRQPLARRTLAVRPQQSIKLRDISPQSRLRLNPPLVAKLGRRTPDHLAHRLPRDPQLANDLADRLFIDPERPPDPANRFHRHHPRPRSPKHNQGEHLTIPGVGRYSMLITPRAGSLFHAVFQSSRRAFSAPARQKPRHRDRQEKRSKASRGQHFSASAFSAIASSRRAASGRFGTPGWRARQASMASPSSILILMMGRRTKGSERLMRPRL